jgi:hypothetical protein
MKPSLTRYRAGLAMGGPVVKDRTFYYAAGEYESTVGQSASDIGSHTLSAVNAMLATGALPNLATRQLTVGLFPTTLEETEFSTRVTHQLSERQSLAARFAATDTRESADAFNAGGLSDVSARGSSGTRDLAFMSTWDATIGQRGINEARGQIATRRVELHTGDTQGPSVLIPGVVEFGRPYAGNDLHDQRYLELGDTARWTAGRHVLSAGGEVTHIRLTGSSTDGLGGMYVFSSLDAFLAKTPSSFRQVFGNPAISFSATRSGAFLQDRWTPRAPLTVDVGVRFDSESLSSSLGIANHLTSPRVGLAWTPGPGWVIRGGAGVFADRLILAAFERSLLVNGVQGFEQVVDGAAAASVLAATQGGSLTSALPNVAPSIYTVRPGAWNSASHQVSAGVERGITSDLTVSANYLFVQGRNLPRTVNVNVPPPGTATTTNTARPNPAYTDIFELQPTASSTYHGVTMAVNRRLANEVAWAASYTWSHTTDTASDFEEQPQNPYALGDELGASRYDQRHRLVASALFDLPIGDEEDRKPGDTPGVWVRVFSQIEVAPILRAGSGSPLNPVTGGDEAQTHSVDLSARPPGVARNSLRLPGTATLDLRVLKAITVKPHGKLDLVFEVFNVFNRVNVTELNTVYGGGLTPLATFGRPIGAGAPRHLQFSIDFEF